MIHTKLCRCHNSTAAKKFVTIKWSVIEIQTIFFFFISLMSLLVKIVTEMVPCHLCPLGNPMLILARGWECPSVCLSLSPPWQVSRVLCRDPTPTGALSMWGNQCHSLIGDKYILTHLPLDKMAAILADDIFNCIFLNENDKILIKISLKYVPRSPIDNKPALVQVMAWRQIGDKPLSEPWCIHAALRGDELTGWGWNKMADILQTAFVQGSRVNWCPFMCITGCKHIDITHTLSEKINLLVYSTWGNEPTNY